jgi:hypothetical protein
MDFPLVTIFSAGEMCREKYFHGRKQAVKTRQKLENQASERMGSP